MTFQSQPLSPPLLPPDSALMTLRLCRTGGAPMGRVELPFFFSLSTPNSPMPPDVLSLANADQCVVLRCDLTFRRPPNDRKTMRESLGKNRLLLSPAPASVSRATLCCDSHGVRAVCATVCLSWVDSRGLLSGYHLCQRGCGGCVWLHAGGAGRHVHAADAAVSAQEARACVDAQGAAFGGTLLEDGHVDGEWGEGRGERGEAVDRVMMTHGSWN